MPQCPIAGDATAPIKYCSMPNNRKKRALFKMSFVTLTFELMTLNMSITVMSFIIICSCVPVIAEKMPPTVLITTPDHQLQFKPAEQQKKNSVKDRIHLN